MVVFYHGDMDGIVSANIYLRNVPNLITDITVKLYEFEYDKEDQVLKVPIGTNGSEEIIFVDCCPNKEILDYAIKMSRKVTILDHHISKKPLIDEYYSEGLISGMSYIGCSASLITYCWFKFNKNIEKINTFLDKYKLNKANQEKSDIPLALKFVNSWDIWDGLYIEAEAYKTYFECQGFKPLDKKIKALLENGLEIQKAVINGNIMLDFYHNWGEQYCQRFGYEVKFQKHNFFVLNVGNANSKIFGDRINKYDAVIIYCNNGEKFKYSIYSNKSEFNCAEFAEQFGGGGHKGAAGFTTNLLPAWLRKKK